MCHDDFEKLRAVEAMRDRLTHMIVHDMKAPIAAIHGYLDMIAMMVGDALPENSAQQLAEASLIAVRLREMILTLLDISRLENDELPLTYVTCDLTSLARNATTMLGSSSATDKIRITSPDEQVTVMCDESIVRRVLLNLMDNALKYSPIDESVTVDIQESTDLDEVLIAVTDQGPGIPEKHHERIFELFGQLEAKEFSTGIGLAFCKMAVEAHGGTLHLQSRPGEGTTFTLHLPRAKPIGTATQRTSRDQAPQST